MNMIENVEAPLAKCPACEGEGTLYRNHVQDYFGVVSADEDECMVCAGEGEIALYVLDEHTEWENGR